MLDLHRVDRSGKIRTDLQDTQPGDLKISFGGEIEYRREGYTGAIPSYDYDLRLGASSKTLDAGFSATRYGSYVELEKRNLASVQGLFALAGVRGDYVGMINASWLDPRFTVGYALSPVSTLRFSIGLFHEYHDPYLYGSSSGNPRLLPMKATHYVLGYDYTPWEGAELRIEAYAKDYSDLPDSNAVTNLDNIGYGYARGIDIIAKGDFSFGLGGVIPIIAASIFALHTWPGCSLAASRFFTSKASTCSTYITSSVIHTPPITRQKPARRVSSEEERSS